MILELEFEKKKMGDSLTHLTEPTKDKVNCNMFHTLGQRKSRQDAISPRLP